MVVRKKGSVKHIYLIFGPAGSRLGSPCKRSMYGFPSVNVMRISRRLILSLSISFTALNVALAQSPEIRNPNTPNAQGLSHNRQPTFDVGRNGTVINNSRQNPNMAQSGPASAILYEVTGTRESELLGIIGVEGQRTDVFIANPNGINCNGCGFQNVDRGVLTTGVPEIVNGRVDAFSVERGTVHIGPGGVLLHDVNLLALIGFGVKVTGAIEAGDANIEISAGRGRVAIHQQNGEELRQLIDLERTLRPGTVAVERTSRGVGVRNSEEMASHTGQVAILDNGDVVLKSDIKTAGRTIVRATKTVRVEKTIFSGEAIALKGESVVLADASKVLASGDVSVNAEKIVDLGENAMIAAGLNENGEFKTDPAKLDVSVETLIGKLDAKLISNDAISVDAIRLQIPKSLASEDYNLFAPGDVELRSGIIGIGSGFVGGNLTVTGKESPERFYPANSTDSIARLRDFDGNQRTEVHGKFTVAGNVNILTAHDLRSSATISSGGNLSLSAEHVVNSDALEAEHELGIVSKTFENRAQGRLSAGVHLNLSAKLAKNVGLIESRGTANITTDDEGHFGALKWERIDHFLGEQDAGESRYATASESSGPQDDPKPSWQLLTPSEYTLKNGETGKIGTFGDLLVSGAEIVNFGAITSAGGDLDIISTGFIVNNGFFYANRDLNLLVDAQAQNTGHVIAGRNIYIGRDPSFDVWTGYDDFLEHSIRGMFRNHEGVVVALDGDLIIEADEILNSTSKPRIKEIEEVSAFSTVSTGVAFRSPDSEVRDSNGNSLGSDHFHLKSGTRAWDTHIDQNQGYGLLRTLFTSKELRGVSAAQRRFLTTRQVLLTPHNPGQLIGENIALNARNLLGNYGSLISATNDVHLNVKSCAALRCAGIVNAGIDASTTMDHQYEIVKAYRMQDGTEVIGRSTDGSYRGDVLVRFGAPSSNTSPLVNSTIRAGGTVYGVSKGDIKNLNILTGVTFANGNRARSSADALLSEISEDRITEVDVSGFVNSILNRPGMYEIQVEQSAEKQAAEELAIGEQGGVDAAIETAPNERIAQPEIGSRAEQVTNLDEPTQSTPNLQSEVVTSTATPNTQRTTQDPLVKTNVPIDTSEYVSSEYLTDKLEEEAPTERRFGDSFVETDLILSQYASVTGLRPLEGIQGIRNHIKTLYDNAAEASQKHGLKVGVALTNEQMARLEKDIVWLIAKRINGQTVLIPKLYLSHTPLEPERKHSAQIVARRQELNALYVENSGEISADEEISINGVLGVKNSAGTISADGDVSVTARSYSINEEGDEVSELHGDIVNESGIIKGRNVSVEGRYIHNSTLVNEYRFSDQRGAINDNVQVAAQPGQITAEQSLSLTASEDIVIEGAVLRAGKEGITVVANGGFYTTGVAVEATRSSKIGRTRTERFQRRWEFSEIATEGDFLISTGGDAQLDGVELKVGGELLPDVQGEVVKGGVWIEDEEGSRQLVTLQDVDTVKTRYRKKAGFLGLSPAKIVEKESISMRTRYSKFDVGGGTIKTDDGDITIGAMDLTNSAPLKLNPGSGNITFEAVRDFEATYETRKTESLVWFNSKSRGREEEVLSSAKVRGAGFEFETDSIVVKHEGLGTTQVAVDSLSKQPGMEWLRELQDNPDVDWQAIDAYANEWDHEAQGLTGAGAALVTIIVTAATQGTMSGVSASLTAGLTGATQAIAQAAIQAGLQSLINQAAVSLINNKGDIGATFEDIGSLETVQSLVTAMGTAGLTSGLSDLLDVGALDSFSDQIGSQFEQGLIDVGVSASSGLINAGIDGTDAWTAVAGALRTSAARTLGSIGNSTIAMGVAKGDVGAITQVLASAGVGCASGVVASGDCGSGALGGSIGGLANVIKQHNMEEWLRENSEAARRGELDIRAVEAEIVAMAASGTEMTKMGAALVAATIGADINTSAQAAGSASALGAACTQECASAMAELKGLIDQRAALEALAQNESSVFGDLNEQDDLLGASAKGGDSKQCKGQAQCHDDNTASDPFDGFDDEQTNELTAQQLDELQEFIDALDEEDGGANSSNDVSNLDEFTEPFAEHPSETGEEYQWANQLQPDDAEHHCHGPCSPSVPAEPGSTLDIDGDGWVSEAEMILDFEPFDLGSCRGLHCQPGDYPRHLVDLPLEEATSQNFSEVAVDSTEFHADLVYNGEIRGGFDGALMQAAGWTLGPLSVLATPEEIGKTQLILAAPSLLGGPLLSIGASLAGAWETGVSTGELLTQQNSELHLLNVPTFRMSEIGQPLTITDNIFNGIEVVTVGFGAGYRLLPESNTFGPLQAQSEITISSSLRGEPGAIWRGLADLNTRQRLLLDRLPAPGEMITVNKRQISQRDVAAMTAATGDEFAVLTLGSRRMIVRGRTDGFGGIINEGWASARGSEGWRWTSHSHPVPAGVQSDMVLRSSQGDQAILRMFPNDRSVILNSVGERRIFTGTGDSLEGWLP